MEPPTGLAFAILKVVSFVAAHAACRTPASNPSVKSERAPDTHHLASFPGIGRSLLPAALVCVEFEVQLRALAYASTLPTMFSREALAGHSISTAMDFR